MKIFISTNLYKAEKFTDIFELLSNIDDNEIGIELFVEYKSKEFKQLINKSYEQLSKYSISIHEPMFETDFSFENGTLEYEKSLNNFVDTLKIYKELNAEYIVHHFNNRIIDSNNKESIIKICKENLDTLNEIAKDYGAEILIENTGVKSHNNVLFSEDEFIKVAESSVNNVLIDIGHAFANGWDLENVIKSLKDKIVSYHIHNNNGVDDSHDRIHMGKLNFDEFMKLYKKYTPNAHLVVEYGTQCAEDINGVIKDIEYIKKFK